MDLENRKIEKKAKEIVLLRNKLFILDFISTSKKSIRIECEKFGVSSTPFYNWRRKYNTDGKEGLKRKKTIAYNHPRKIQQYVIDKILELRKEYQL